MTEFTPYRPRQFSFVDVWKIDDLQLKFYTITQREEARSIQRAIDAAQSYAAETLAAARQEEGTDHQLGYGMLHPGQMGNWLLLHWWAHEDIALAHLALAEDLETPQFVSQEHRRFHACVWEHLIINHERNAWVRNIMAISSSPADYLRDRLPDGLY